MLMQPLRTLHSGCAAYLHEPLCPSKSSWANCCGEDQCRWAVPCREMEALAGTIEDLRTACRGLIRYLQQLRDR